MKQTLRPSLSFVPAAAIAVAMSAGAPSARAQGQEQITPNSSGTMQALPTEPTAAGYNASPSASDARESWLPYTTAGYIGLSLGNGKLDTVCVAGQTCEDPSGAVHLYLGGMFTPYVGIQLGYFRLGDTDRNGGTVKVSGANLVLTGVAPLGYAFSLVGRVGGTYGWTETSVGLGVPAPAGDRTGFGASYGAGLSWDFNRNWSATLDWDRHHLKFAGDDRKKLDVATIGLKYRF